MNHQPVVLTLVLEQPIYWKWLRPSQTSNLQRNGVQEGVSASVHGVEENHCKGYQSI